jgi:hypothetical protein
MQPAREGADPAHEGADPGTAPAVAGADEPATPAPDVVVALERPAPEGWPRLVTFVHATDSAQPVPVQALGPVDAMAGSGDGIQGFEPGARYWFGPRGLEKLPISTEAQR